jgi:tetratricopeptide (TPR) repeat protein
MIAPLLLALALAQVPAQTSDEDALRVLVQQHADAQARDEHSTISVDVRRVEIDGDTARIRALVDRTRMVPGRGGAMSTQRTATLLLETWTREGASWKLVDERPLADVIADGLMAASADRWRAMLAAEDAAFVMGPLRTTVALRGSTAAASQQYASALVPFSLLREIGRSANAPRVQLEALQNLGNTYFFLRRYQEAADAYSEEVALARGAHDEDYEAAALDGTAMVAYSRGEYAAALDGYQAALGIAERRSDGPAAGRALVSVGNVQYLQGDYDLAAGSYRRAMSLLEEAHDHQTLAMAWRGAARVYTAEGDLASALAAQTRALDDARVRAARSEIANDQESVGELHFKLGNTAEARSAFDDARQMFDVLHDSESAGRVLGDIGLTELVAERFDAAVAAYTQSRDRFQQAKDPVGIGHAWVGIGFSEAGRGRFPDAIDAYQVAIGIFDAGDHKEDAGRAWLGLSLAHYASADFHSALDDAGRVSAIAADIHNDDLAWRAHVRTGDALRRLHRLDGARDEFNAAISIIRSIAAVAATSTDARTMLEDSGSAWAGLAFTLTEQGDAAGALLAAEQRHSHILRVMLAPFERDITRGMTADEAAAERASFRATVSLLAQRRAERASPKPDRDRLARIEDQLASAVRTRDRQQRALYERRPDLALWRGLRPISSIEQVGSALDPQTLAVEFIAEDDELLVLTVARERRATDDGLWTSAVDAAIVPWHRHDIEVTLAHALEPAAVTDALEWTARTRLLADTLMPPIASRLTGRTHLVVVPDDVLWSVPFEALPFASSDVESVVQVSYSSSLYTRALRRGVRDDGDVAFVAAPALTIDTASALAAAAPDWTPQDSTAVLKTVEEEAALYGERAHVTSHSDATQASAVQSLERDALVEVAARLQLSGAAPFFSSVVLAPITGDGADDGRWEVREWLGASAHGAVLVLPDCGGTATAGLGAAMTALDWASAAGGTSAVLIARTPGGAFAVEAILRAFHTARAAGASVEAAYAAAVTEVRESGNRAPAVWASVRMLGRFR